MVTQLFRLSIESRAQERMMFFFIGQFLEFKMLIKAFGDNPRFISELWHALYEFNITLFYLMNEVKLFYQCHTCGGWM